VTAPPDIESLLVWWLEARQPDLTVATDLDGLFDDSTPLVVQVNSLPGRADAPGWNGPSQVYRMDLDVDFYGPSRIAALDLALLVTGTAAELRGAVHPTYGRVTQVVAPAATRRPDFNQRIRRYGAVWSITARPA